MMLLNKITVFVLVLCIIAGCEARKTRKKSKLVGKKLSEYSVNSKDITWPIHSETPCDIMPTSDTGYTKGKQHELKSWPDCGLNHFSKGKRETKFQRKWKSFQKSLFKLEQSLEAIKSFGKKGSDHRIINGHPADEGRWPWLAAIGLNRGEYAGQFCGASIIDKLWVLTAAHCFNYTKDYPCQYTVRAGTRNWVEDLDGTAVDRTVVGIYKHPKYDDGTHHHDIALLKLDKPLDLAPDSHINAICLPEGPRSAPIDTPCFSAGWGLLVADRNDSSSVNLMETKLPVIAYGGEGKCDGYDDDEFLPGEVCAGYTNGYSDTCQGDSGGPLTYVKEDKFYLLGAVSWGHGCAQKGIPGIYTDVGQYLDWIASVMGRFG